MIRIRIIAIHKFLLNWGKNKHIWFIVLSTKFSITVLTKNFDRNKIIYSVKFYKYLRRHITLVMSIQLRIIIFVCCLVVFNNKLITAKKLPESKNVKSRDVWLPRQLGTFHLKDAGFVEVFPITPSVTSTSDQNLTSYADNYNLFITTFNAGNLLSFSDIIK